MACVHCGRLCLDPHEVDADYGECCLVCGEILEYCTCHRCYVCKAKLTADERADDVCADCLRLGPTIDEGGLT